MGKQQTTDIDVTVNHTGSKSFKQETSNVSIADFGRGSKGVFLTLTVPIDAAWLREHTGLQSDREIAVWLQEQMGSLDDLLSDPDNVVTQAVLETLDNYATFDKNEGRLQRLGNPCGGCHHTRAAHRLARGRNG